MGKKNVEVAECVWCDCITIEPESDLCACGQELYPISRTIKPGTRFPGSLDGFNVPLVRDVMES